MSAVTEMQAVGFIDPLGLSSGSVISSQIELIGRQVRKSDSRSGKSCRTAFYPSCKDPKRRAFHPN